MRLQKHTATKVSRTCLNVTFIRSDWLSCFSYHRLSQCPLYDAGSNAHRSPWLHDSKMMRVKGKVVPFHTTKSYRKQKYIYCLFLTSASLRWEKATGTHWVEAFVGPETVRAVLENTTPLATCQDANPGPSRPQQVGIPTTLSRLPVNDEPERIWKKQP